MVEQRSPKPLVACSNRVSPASKKVVSFLRQPFFHLSNHLFGIIKIKPLIYRDQKKFLPGMCGASASLSKLSSMTSTFSNTMISSSSSSVMDRKPSRTRRFRNQIRSYSPSPPGRSSAMYLDRKHWILGRYYLLSHLQPLSLQNRNSRNSRCRRSIRLRHRCIYPIPPQRCSSTGRYLHCFLRRRRDRPYYWSPSRSHSSFARHRR